MRYERIKHLTAAMSMASVGITLAVATTLGDSFWGQGGFWVPLTLATGIAAGAAALNIEWARRLARARANRRVFMIYAREDVDIARHLSDLLRRRGFRPWLDVEEIRPGVVWPRAVMRSLEESAVALVLVSQHLNKEGFVQREMKAALDLLQQPDADISPVIPVLIDGSPVPARLRDVQWVDLREPDSEDKLLEGLRRLAMAGSLRRRGSAGERQQDS